MSRPQKQKGFVLVSTILMLSVLMTLVAAYFVTTDIELASTRHSKDSVSGFYAAEASLNLRAEEVRQTFVGYNRPTGSSPLDDTANIPCTGTNMGSGDFACKTISVGTHSATTYVVEDETNPIVLTIPPGERYQNLNAQEYRYSVKSVARNRRKEVDAVLELRFKSRLVPLFQFAAFYDKDLEILPGAAMKLEGPVHTNGDLYLNTEASLDVSGQVTTAGDFNRGRKNNSSCLSKPVRVPKSGTLTAVIPSCSARVKVKKSDISSWNGMIQLGVEPVTVPGPEVFDPEPGAVYWDKADLRLVLALNTNGTPVTTYSSSGVQVRNADDSVDTTMTTALAGCSGSISGKAVGTATDIETALYNNREGKRVRALEIDMRALLDCIHNNNLLGPTKTLDETTEGGNVFYFTVKGKDSSKNSNNYGTRITNAATLRPTVSGAPYPKGMSIISDQAVYVQGDFNKTNKIPAAIMADSFNVLSSSWTDGKSKNNVDGRIPVASTINAAILSGTDTTGNAEGSSGQGGSYNGGLENYPRFHENWGGVTFTYNGSMVSLNNAQHVNGAWVYGSSGNQYYAPTRDWHYDTMFNDAAKLPPITPRFVYLRQELFVRDYEQ